jgi:hypothetical protein
MWKGFGSSLSIRLESFPGMVLLARGGFFAASEIIPDNRLGEGIGEAEAENIHDRLFPVGIAQSAGKIRL